MLYSFFNVNDAYFKGWWLKQCAKPHVFCPTNADRFNKKKLAKDIRLEQYSTRVVTRLIISLNTLIKYAHIFLIDKPTAISILSTTIKNISDY